MALSTVLEPHEKGEIFEQYVRKRLFDYNHYELLDRAPRYTADREQFALSALRPDFKFRERKTGLVFLVEAKYRTLYDKNNLIRWSYRAQRERYLAYNREYPTFLLIGLGRHPERPDLLGLLPITQANYNCLFLKHIKQFKTPVDQPIPPKELWIRGKLPPL